MNLSICGPYLCVERGVKPDFTVSQKHATVHLFIMLSKVFWLSGYSFTSLLSITLGLVGNEIWQGFHLKISQRLWRWKIWGKVVSECTSVAVCFFDVHYITEFAHSFSYSSDASVFSILSTQLVSVWYYVLQCLTIQLYVSSLYVWKREIGRADIWVNTSSDSHGVVSNVSMSLTI